MDVTEGLKKREAHSSCQSALNASTHRPRSTWSRRTSRGSSCGDTMGLFGMLVSGKRVLLPELIHTLTKVHSGYFLWCGVKVRVRRGTMLTTKWSTRVSSSAMMTVPLSWVRWTRQRSSCCPWFLAEYFYEDIFLFTDNISISLELVLKSLPIWIAFHPVINSRCWLSMQERITTPRTARWPLSLRMTGPILLLATTLAVLSRSIAELGKYPLPTFQVPYLGSSSPRWRTRQGRYQRPTDPSTRQVQAITTRLGTNKESKLVQRAQNIQHVLFQPFAQVYPWPKSSGQDTPSRKCWWQAFHVAQDCFLHAGWYQAY